MPNTSSDLCFYVAIQVPLYIHLVLIVLRITQMTSNWEV